MNGTGRELAEAIRKEVEHWPGVSVEFVDGGKHPKAKFKFGEMVLSRPFAGTMSDSAFGVHRVLGDMRRIMKQLGAIRDKPEPSKEEDEKPYRRPNGGAEARPHPVETPKAKPKPTLAEQLVDAGIAQPTEPLAPVEDVETSEPAEKLLGRLRERGFELTVAGPVSRASIIACAVAMIEDGIYFGLPDEVYHNVPRLGASGLIDLNKSAGDFWVRSWLNPDRPGEDEDDKAWKIVGRAYHCARLEPDQFEVRYCRKPAKADYAEHATEHGACWNGTEIGAALADLGETKKMAGESVASQAARLRDCGYEGVLWPLIEAEFEAAAGDRIALDGKVWDEIMRDMERLRGTKEIAAKFTEAGASEVSVFWTDENNIQRKARFDRLEPSLWLDFKTFDNSRNKRLDQAIADAVRYNRYYVVAASYRDAAEAIRTAGLAVRGLASEVERDLVAYLQTLSAPLSCWFLFQQKSGVPNLVAREFHFFDVPDDVEHHWDTGADEEAIERVHDLTRRPTQIYAKGRAEIDYAKRLFATYSQVYQPGEPWAPLDPVGSVTDLDFNPRWLEGLYD